MLALLEWLAAQWPFVVSGALVVGGVAAWVQRLKTIQELQLKINALERAAVEKESRIAVPTAHEVAKYGAQRVPTSTTLLLIALVGPTMFYAYDVYRRHQQIERLRGELQQTTARLTAADKRLQDTTEELNRLRRRYLEEVSGISDTGLRGVGPIARELKALEQSIQVRERELRRAREDLLQETQRLQTQLERTQ